VKTNDTKFMLFKEPKYLSFWEFLYWYRERSK